MTSRERLMTVLCHRTPDRVPIADIAPAFWPHTLRRWTSEGLPEGMDPRDYFGMDRIEIMGFDGSLGLPEVELERGDRWRMYRDANGVTIKEWAADSGEYSPQSRVSCLVDNRDAWRKVKGRLAADRARFPDRSVRLGREWNARGWFTVLAPIDPAWFLLEMLTGFEVGLPLLLDDPDLARDIMATYTDFTLGMCQLCVDTGVVFDALWFFSDLCYRNGMLFSPKCYREMIRPLHLRFREWCDANHMPMMLHCDGDVRAFIPLLIDVGFDAIQPLEARCGNDVRELKRRHGTDIVFFGNVSADVIADGSDDELEIEVRSKVLAAKEGGGYIYHVDHSIPPTISLARYGKVVEMVKECASYDS